MSANKTLYKNVNLFDGLHNKIIKDAYLLVNNQNGKFIKVGTGPNLPKANKVVNIKNKYVMPGLFNVHTHISMNPSDPSGIKPDNPIQATIRAVKHLHQLLESGVTYIRGCGCKYRYLDTTLAKMEREGKLKKVPEMMPAGLAMSATGGHGDSEGHSDSALTDSPDEMRKEVRTNFRNGARCTKVMSSGGVTSPQDNMFQAELTIPEMKVAVQESHNRGYVVAAHAQGNPGIYNAIVAGVDSVEHGCYVNSKEIKMMLKRGIYLTPTFGAPCSILNQGRNSMPHYIYDETYDVFKAMCHNIHNAYKQGVKITLGTDAGSPFNKFSYTPRELEYLVTKAGFSNFDALSTIRNSASLLKLKDYGTIQNGKVADFIVLDNNPLEDVRAVQQRNKDIYKKGIKEF